MLAGLLPVYETFDGVVLDEDGGTHKFFHGQAVDLNGWSFQISRSDGTVDPSGFIVLTNQTIDTTLANENTDKAMVMLGKSTHRVGPEGPRWRRLQVQWHFG